tara:strand:- start:261 stop:818 length:558 start_codon:yes stop_codon:yes gene_type:complete
MKIIITLMTLLLSYPLSAKDTYIKFGMGQQDGLNGSNDAKEYGLTVGRKLNDFFAAEVKTRTKLKDQSTGNDQRAEFALIGSVKLHDRIKMYTRAGAGRKFTRNKDHGYWHAEPGFSFKLTDTWSFKTGIRFRDSFDPIYEQSDITYKFGFGYKIDDQNSLSIGSKIKRGDSQYNSIGIGYKYKF